ncbi:MAG: hypothetical protein Q8N57_02950 [bacterium]|nr:hypothetical protein [bacterium]
MNTRTRIISAGQELPIGDLDGKIIISQAKDIYKSGIDPDFKKFGLDKPSRPTQKINAVVSEMTADGTFLQIFKDIDPDLDKSVLTMSQIIKFCESHPDWLPRNGFGTFFLTKKMNIFLRIFNFILKIFFKKINLGKYFVVRVRVYADGLFVYVRRLGHDGVWRGEFRRRVVSPQL